MIVGAAAFALPIGSAEALRYPRFRVDVRAACACVRGAT